MELAPPDLVSVAAQAGYHSVGLRLVPVAGQTLPSYDARELERRLADSGVTVLDVEVFRVSPEMPDYEPALEIAGRLGATEILVHGADPEEARQAHSFAALCELAARYGLHANLEPMPWVEVSTVAKAKRLIERAGKGALLLDPIHFYRADNRIAELSGAPLRYLQFCDAHPGRPTDPQELMRQARGDRLFPGEGALDLRALLQAVAADLPISVEVPYAKPMAPLERARRALSATREVLARCAAA
jgi:sugar phosphate isomerase/epimerase